MDRSAETVTEKSLSREAVPQETTSPLETNFITQEGRGVREITQTLPAEVETVITASQSSPKEVSEEFEETTPHPEKVLLPAKTQINQTHSETTESIHTHSVAVENITKVTPPLAPESSIDTIEHLPPQEAIVENKIISRDVKNTTPHATEQVAQTPQRTSPSIPQRHQEKQAILRGPRVHIGQIDILVQSPPSSKSAISKVPVATPWHKKSL